MRILDRYLLKELLIPFGYCLTGFLIFWITSDLFGSLDDLQDAELKGIEIVEYYWALTPEFLIVILPVSLLLALLYSLSQHARNHEITAILSAGVSYWRLCFPYLGTALVLCLVVFYLNEYWVPNGRIKAEQMRNRDPNQAAQAYQVVSNINFNNDSDARSWHIGGYDLGADEMVDVDVRMVLGDGRVKHVTAKRGVWENGKWRFFGVQRFLYEGSPDSIPIPDYDDEAVFEEMSETPEQIRSEIKVGRLTGARAARDLHLSLAEIREYQRLHPDLSGHQKALLATQFQGRLATCFIPLVVVLIAMPFGLKGGGGRRNVFVGVASSIFICFIYYVLRQVGLAMGTGGRLPPWFAAWMPNLGFMVWSLWVMNRKG